MGNIANYILNGPSLESSTGLTTAAGGPAPDGFYSDGVTVRQLQNGCLLQAKSLVIALQLAALHL